MAGKKTKDKAVGRTRGGLNTKLHAVVDNLGRPIEFLLSPGNGNDCTHAVELLEQVEITESNILADRAYGAKEIREYISGQGASYTIPPRRNVSEPWPVDLELYKRRNVIERFFQKLKWFRRVATRYDKLDSSFLAFVYLASISILLMYVLPPIFGVIGDGVKTYKFWVFCTLCARTQPAAQFIICSPFSEA